MHNISLETSDHWLSEDLVRNLQKCNSEFTKKSHLTTTFTQVIVTMAMISLPVVRLFCTVWAIVASVREDLAQRRLCIGHSLLTALRYGKFV